MRGRKDIVTPMLFAARHWVKFSLLNWSWLCHLLLCGFPFGGLTLLMQKLASIQPEWNPRRVFSAEVMPGLQKQRHSPLHAQKAWCLAWQQQQQGRGRQAWGQRLWRPHGFDWQSERLCHWRLGQLGPQGLLCQEVGGQHLHAPGVSKFGRRVSGGVQVQRHCKYKVKNAETGGQTLEKCGFHMHVYCYCPHSPHAETDLRPLRSPRCSHSTCVAAQLE